MYKLKPLENKYWKLPNIPTTILRNIVASKVAIGPSI